MIFALAAFMSQAAEQPRTVEEIMESDPCAIVLCAGRPRPDLTAAVPIILVEAEQGGLSRGAVSPGSRIQYEGREVAVSPDGAFIVGFDRDAGPQAMLTITDRAGSRRGHVYEISPRRWSVQRVNVARNLPREGDESWTRREAEVLRTQAARARQTDAQGWRQDFIWPARGRISGRFGSQRIYRGEPGNFHGGVDVAAPTGSPVVAPADGVVVLAAPGFSLEGNLVIVDHGFGLSSSFLHLSRIDVREGQSVRQGEGIGAIGATGRATGPHLHWALTWHGAKLDPERVVPAMP